jgi:hypothetical protein
MMRKCVVKYSKCMLLGLNPSGYYMYRSFEFCAIISLEYCVWLSQRTRKTFYVQHNIAAHSSNHWSSKRTIRITYSECVFLDLGIHHAMRMLDIVICGLSGSAIFFHMSQNVTIFDKKSYWTQIVCFDFLHNFYLKLSHSKRNWATCYKNVCLHVNYPLFFSDFN